MTRVWQTSIDCFNAGDWEGIRATLEPDFVREDRRSLVALPVATGAEAWVGQAQLMVESGYTKMGSTVVATRGDRLALFDLVLETQEGQTSQMLTLAELSHGGRFAHGILFDAEDDAAIAELERRHLGLGA